MGGGGSGIHGPVGREKAFEGSMEEGIPSSERAIQFIHTAIDRLYDSAGGVWSAEWWRVVIESPLVEIVPFPSLPPAY